MSDATRDLDGVVLASVVQCVCDVLALEPHAVDPSMSLIELGAESLDFLELVFHIERKCHVRVPREYAVPDPRHTTVTYVNAVMASNGARV